MHMYMIKIYLFLNSFKQVSKVKEICRDRLEDLQSFFN